MELSAHQVAHLLQESEETIYRWAHEGTLPAHRVQEQYRFNRVELQEWASRSGHRVLPALFADAGGRARPTSLHAALVRGGLHDGIAGARREEVLAAVAQLATIPASVDRALLLQLLLGRERLASTAVGDGIAIPHPRDPLVLGVELPVVLLCFLAQPVDFGAIDGQPVRVLFTLLSPTVRAHLQTLSALAFALHDGELRRLLASADHAAILPRLQTIETELARPPAGDVEHR
jgi:nitrogen PTS system EIIA component